MSLKEYLKLLAGKKETIFSIVFLVFLISLLLTFVQPLKYSAEEKLLIVQSFPASADPYSFSKSNEFFSNIFAQVIKSKSFFDQTMNTDFEINRDYFFGDSREQMNKWSKTVDARAMSDTGIIEIKVYHTDKMQAEQIAQAISYVFKTNHQEYHGAGDKIAVKQLDNPIISRLPVKPNIFFNLVFGLLFGFIIAFCYVYLLPGDENNLSFFSKRKKLVLVKKRQINLDNFEPTIVTRPTIQRQWPETPQPKYYNTQPPKQPESFVERQMPSETKKMEGNINNIF